MKSLSKLVSLAILTQELVNAQDYDEPAGLDNLISGSFEDGVDSADDGAVASPILDALVHMDDKVEEPAETPNAGTMEEEILEITKQMLESDETVVDPAIEKARK